MSFSTGRKTTRKISGSRAKKLHSESLEPRYLLTSYGGPTVEDGGATIPVDVAGSYFVARRPGDFKAMDANDVRQGSLDTCGFTAILSAVAATPFDLQSGISLVKTNADGSSEYRVRVFTPSSSTPTWRTVHYSGTRDPVDPRYGDDGEFWTLLYQRAYLDLQAELGQPQANASASFRALTGATVEHFDVTGGLTDARRIEAALNAGRATIVSTIPDGPFVLDGGLGIIKAHAYTVVGMEVPASGNLSQTYITLRNPWGIDTHWTHFDADGNGTLSSQENWLRLYGVDGTNDGLVRVPWSKFAQFFDDYWSSNQTGPSLNRPLEPNDKPVFANPNLGPFVVREGEWLGPITVSATDPENQTLSYSLGEGSPGYVQVQTGQFTWEPPAGSAGTYAVTVVAAVNDFDTASNTFLVQVQSGAPRIGSLQASPTSIKDDGSDVLTLTGKNVVHDFDTIDKVEFWRDANGNGQLDTSSDVWLGLGTQSGADWAWSGSPGGLSPGNQTFFARAGRFSFSDLHWSATKSIVVTVTAAPRLDPVAIPRGDQIAITPSATSDYYIGGLERDAAGNFYTLSSHRESTGDMSHGVWSFTAIGQSRFGSGMEFNLDASSLVVNDDGTYAVAFSQSGQLKVRYWSSPSTSTLYSITADAWAQNPYVQAAADANGNLLIVYNKGNYFDEDVWAVSVDRSGSVTRAPWQLNTFSESMQKYPSVALNAAGNGVIAWNDGQQGKIIARQVSSYGLANGPEFEVAAEGQFDSLTRSAAEDNGQFWVSWSYNAARVRRYDAAGQPLAAAFNANTFNGTYPSPAAITTNASGWTVMGWANASQDSGAYEYGIYAQVLAPDGTKVGPEFRVPNNTAYDQGLAGLTLLDDGTVIVGWNDGGWESPNNDMPYFRFFDLEVAPAFRTPNSFAVSENSAAGTVVGTVQAATADLSAAVSYELVGTSPFAIHPSTGRLTLAQSNALDFEGVRTYSLSVRATADGKSTLGTVVVNVTNANDAPVFGGLPGTFTYTEQAAPLLIADGRSLVDGDSTNFGGGGFLRVSLTANGNSQDRLAVSPAYGISVYQNNLVVLNGKVIATMTHNGQGTTPLGFWFNQNAAPAAVETLLKSITFSTAGDNPSSQARTVKFTIADGDGGVSSFTAAVKVQPVNDAPRISNFGGPVSYQENASPVAIAPTATVADPDSANFAGGWLTTKFLAGGQITDRLSIRSGGELVVSGNELWFKGLLIGRFTGGVGTTPLVVTLTAQATPYRVQVLVQRLSFHNVSDNPTGIQRRVGLHLADGDGHSSLQVTKFVNVAPVNDAPALAPNNTTVGYRLNAAAITLLGTATVKDSDTADFAKGWLQVKVNQGSDVSNRLFLGGAFTVVSTNGVQNVVFNGTTVIGTLNADGGVGSKALVVYFNQNATLYRVEQLLRSLKFRTVGGTSTAPRTIALTLNDGDGGTSNTVSKTINVTA